MPLNPLQNRLKDLPLILCGPIVRRVEQEEVSVWVALKAKREVELSIWEDEKMAAGEKKFIGNSEAWASSEKMAALEVGKHLFIALVHLKGVQLQSGRGYAYNLSFFGGSQPEDLSSLGLLLDQEPGENESLPYFKQLALGYDSNKFPSFVVPPSDIQDLKIAHGSCRKDGGQGKDALAALDDLIRGTLTREHRRHRPQALFLTGDQIYANSLSKQLLPFLTDAGNTLIGKTETAPILEEHEKREEEKIHYYPIDQAHFPAGWRKDFLVRQAFFTGAGDSHLCSFGEYCASYLFYWSNVLWDKELLNFSSWWKDIYFPHLEQVRKITEQVYANAAKKDRKYQLEQIDGIRLLFSRLDALRDTYPKLELKWIGTLEDILNYEDDDEGEKASEALERINRQLKQEQENIKKKIEDLETEIERSKNKERGGLGKEIAALRKTIGEIKDFMKIKDWVAAVENGAHAYKKGKERVAEFRSYLPKVRRALANISTLMIFDDHDVTDDWFITGEWRKKTLTFPLGLTVNRNALLAFALFQAAGNRPDYFDFKAKKKEGGKLLAQIPYFVAKMPARVAKADDPFIALVNKIDPLLWSEIKTDSKKDSTVEWHFDLKLGPTHVFALDTRVNRDYSAGDQLPPGLITKASLKKQLNFGEKVPHNLEFVIVVSAVPVLGLSTMEDIGQVVGSRAVDFFVLAGKVKDLSPLNYEDLKGRFSLDLEAWSFNEQAYERLLAHLFSRKRVLFLSGDVHYGTASSLDYWKKGASKPARFIQFTSSAMRNEKGPTITNVAMSGFAQQVLSEGLDQVFLERTKFGWPENKGINFSSPLPLKWRKILWKKPVLIPAWQFPKDITLAGETVPEWVWRLQVGYDTRTDEERPRGVVRPLTKDVAASPMPEELRPVFQRHIHQMHQRMSRRVNFNANIGLVRIERGPDQKLYAIQDLYAYHPTEDQVEDPQAYHRYRVLFEPTEEKTPILNPDYAAD